MSSPTPRRPNQHKQTKKKNTALSPWAWVFVVLGGLVLLGSLWGAYKFYMWWNPPAKYERDFSLQWDEEVKLHDGRMIVVNIKRKFRRQYLHLEYERVWYLGTEISFDAGEPWGRYTRYFQGYDVNMIDHVNGKWYFVLYDASPGSGPEKRLVNQSLPYWVLDRESEYAVELKSDLPVKFHHNIFPMELPLSKANELDKKKLGWNEKIKILQSEWIHSDLYWSM